MLETLSGIPSEHTFLGGQGYRIDSREESLSGEVTMTTVRRHVEMDLRHEHMALTAPTIRIIVSR